jgi:mRNA interferase RelE/StbE
VYRVVFTKQADRTLRKVPHNVAQRIRAKSMEVAADPYATSQNVTKLVGRPAYRLRVGDWRVLYELQDDQAVMLILRIGPRGEIYR